MGMLVGIVAAVLLLACLLFAGGGCSRATPPAPPSPIVTVEGVKSLDRAAVRAMLKRLADTPPPKAKTRGAMCYSVALPPDRADYICPKCGERTIYDLKTSATERPGERGITETVEWGIASCRRQFEELRKVAGKSIMLDESQYCRKCSPKVVSPKLVLHVSYNGEKARDIENIDSDDLHILTDFLAGNLLTESYDDKNPLKDDLPRLQELLGVKLDE
jgi:hypothetical protein